MRPLVQPPPTLQCDICRGELRLKQIDPCGPVSDLDVEIFVCTKCSHEQSFRVSHDRYAAHLLGKEPPAKVG